MRKSLSAFIAIAAVASVAVAAFALQSFTRAATPSPSTTFASPTTIYIASGVTDSGDGPNTGTATTVLCSNISGVSAGMRFLVLNAAGGTETT